MKIVGISDLHGYLPTLPSCDVVCVCGDIVPLDYQKDYEQSIAWFCLEFIPWTDSLDCKKVILVGGNHDFFLEKLHKRLFDDTYRWRSPSDVLKKLLPGENKGKHKLVYLCDSLYEFEGITFYGSPWVGELKNWAFYKSSEELKETYGKIPNKCDVLLTHMPPKMCGCGEVLQHGCHNTGANYGSSELEEVIMAKNIKWSLSGHIHSGSHFPVEYENGKYVANCSIKDENYEVQYQPLTFEINKKERIVIKTEEDFEKYEKMTSTKIDPAIKEDFKKYIGKYYCNTRYKIIALEDSGDWYWVAQNEDDERDFKYISILQCRE